MRKEGCSVAAIARELNVSEPTVRKYLKVRDLSPKPSVKRARPSKIDPWVPLIEQWLAEDRESWSKQRHTATRIHERLVHEHGADVSRSMVNRKVGELKRWFRFGKGERVLMAWGGRHRPISDRYLVAWSAHAHALLRALVPVFEHGGRLPDPGRERGVYVCGASWSVRASGRRATPHRVRQRGRYGPQARGRRGVLHGTIRRLPRVFFACIGRPWIGYLQDRFNRVLMTKLDDPELARNAGIYGKAQ